MSFLGLVLLIDFSPYCCFASLVKFDLMTIVDFIFLNAAYFCILINILVLFLGQSYVMETVGNRWSIVFPSF